MASSKEIFQALPAERLTDFAEFPPPAVFARAMRLSARLRLGSRLTPGNLVISNVPGPREPLYAAGARLEHYYPVSTIIDGQGLNITVQSYLDRLDWGLVACAELVPDVDALLDDIIADIDTLAAAAAAASPKRHPRSGGAGRRRGLRRGQTGAGADVASKRGPDEKRQSPLSGAFTSAEEDSNLLGVTPNSPSSG